MGTTVEVRDGRPVVVRTAENAAADAIRHEANVLRSIAGPGVPSLLEFEETSASARLVVRVAPPLTLSGASKTTVLDALVRLAEVLARAHGAGFSHGPIHDEDVLADGDGVLLSGWRRDADATPEGDVLELGRFIRKVAGDDRALRAIVARTAASDPPTMTAVAESLQRLATVSPPLRVPSRYVRVVVTLACVAAVALVLWNRPSKVTTTVARQGPDVVAKGNVIERAGRRWVIGEPGDVAAVGRWNCDGRVLPAVLRLSTQRIWIFDSWPNQQDPVRAHLARTAPHAVRLRVRPDGPCDRLDALDVQGRSTPVR
jgi:hypothetical protein